jgi:hypothetical protein
MLLVLAHGLETNADLQDRLGFLVNHRVWWIFGWLTWTGAALAILYFYIAFADAHRPSSYFAVLLTVAAFGPDLAAQAIEIGVLPSLAAQALSRNAAPELFLALHRVAVMLSGFAANGLYSMTALILAWGARREYPPWVSSMGFAVGVSGIALSVAALLDSTAGMFWTNVLLVPALALWLIGVARLQAGRSQTAPTV